MKIFVHSVSIDDIRSAAESGLADGVSLPVTELDSTEKVLARIGEIDREFALPISVAVSAFNAAEMYREARELARASEHVIVEVPFVEDAVTPIRKLVDDGVNVCASYIYSGVQAFLAAKVGAKQVSIAVDDLDTHGLRGAAVIAEIRDVIDTSDLECDIMIASPRSAGQVTDALLAGADSICVSPALARELMLHALTDRGVDRFLRDVSRRGKPRGG
jgi:transaldolase